MVILGKRLDSDAQMLCCASLSASVCRSLAPVCAGFKQFVPVLIRCLTCPYGTSYKQLCLFWDSNASNKRTLPFPQCQALHCEGPSSQWLQLFQPQCRLRPPASWPQQDSQTSLLNRDKHVYYWWQTNHNLNWNLKHDEAEMRASSKNPSAAPFCSLTDNLNILSQVWVIFCEYLIANEWQVAMTESADQLHTMSVIISQYCLLPYTHLITTNSS